jgi:hypothetical protein
MLLPVLENIEQVMVEKFSEKLKAKWKAIAGHPEAKSNPKRKAEKFCQHCKTHGSPHQTHNTSNCCCYDKDDQPLDAVVGKSSDSTKLYEKFGG